MKTLLAIFLFSASTYAYDSYNQREPSFLKDTGAKWTYMTKEDCKRSDAKVEVNVGVEDMDPRIIYVRENDRVCMIVHSEDVRVSLSIEKYPVTVTVQRNKSEMVYFRANKVGEFNLICRSCADGKNFKGARLVVQKQADFDKAQEEYLRKEAEEYRLKSYDRERRYRK